MPQSTAWSPEVYLYRFLRATCACVDASPGCHTHNLLKLPGGFPAVHALARYNSRSQQVVPSVLSTASAAGSITVLPVPNAQAVRVRRFPSGLTVKTQNIRP